MCQGNTDDRSTTIIKFEDLLKFHLPPVHLDGEQMVLECKHFSMDMMKVQHKSSHFSRIYNGFHIRSTLRQEDPDAWGPSIVWILKSLTTAEPDHWTGCSTGFGTDHPDHLDRPADLDFLAGHGFLWTRLPDHL